MKDKLCLWLIAIMCICMASCDDDSFTVSPSAVLTFSADTISVDTVFSNIPSSMRSFWAYNRNGDGVRCTSVRLERGNQSGFRVNVRGTYLGPEVGYQMNDIELHKGDSLRVFVELTTSTQHHEEPTQVVDNLIFTLESGKIQKVNLKAYSWDATLMGLLEVNHDTTLTGPKPIVIRRGIHVAEGATLTIAPGTTLYFHGLAGMDIDGTLRCEGTADQPVTLRGDRLDRMFSYLPYDRVSGQWQGIRLHASSFDNVLNYTDLHGAFDGIVADSSDVSQPKLTLTQSTIHNCKGVGVSLAYAKATIANTQITNTLNHCLYIRGGDVDINQCTIAQYYPFDGNRQTALCFESPIYRLLCQNTLITGYADDEMLGVPGEVFHYDFRDCIIRTPKIVTADSIHFERVDYESPEDTLHYGRKHFARFDTANLIYDFSLDSVSRAIDRANPATSLPYDRTGYRRDDHPDIGAYELRKQ